VLEALLAADFQDVETLRRQAADAVVVGTCGSVVRFLPWRLSF
jgi:hypothetical protein